MSPDLRDDLISVIIPVGERQAPLVTLYAEYREALSSLGRPYEVLFVLDGPQPQAESDLLGIQQSDDRVTVLKLSRAFGEATALMGAFEKTRGGIIMTLPAYFQIRAQDGIPALLAALEQADMAVAHRWPRAGRRFEHVRRALFHGMISRVTGAPFRDLGCGARAMKRIILEQVALYGDQHRFLPVLAVGQGFKVREIDVPQSPQDAYTKGYGVREYVRRFLDLITLLFLVRFTKKPLRFFGMIGVLTTLVGLLLITWMVAERLFFDVGLAERPALLLASLLSVLGLQLLAIGLLGELIIFTHARDIKEYQVAEVIERQPPDADGNESSPTAAEEFTASRCGHTTPRSA